MLPIAVLVSGSGSNLQALIDSARRDPDFGAKIVVVISDRREVRALERAEAAGVPTVIVEWEGDRTRFTAAVCDAAETFGAEAMVLAGFMRILGPEAIARFPNRILNTHPSLLPAFPGAHAVEQALARGVAVTGVTVHFVDELVDHGPIIDQVPVRVEPGDTVEVLHERIKAAEHRLYPTVVKDFALGRIDVIDGKAAKR